MPVPSYNYSNGYHLGLQAHKQHIQDLETAIRTGLLREKVKGWEVFSDVTVGLLQIDLVVINPKSGVQVWEVDDGIIEEYNKRLIPNLDRTLSSVDRDVLELAAKAGKRVDLKSNVNQLQPRDAFSRLFYVREHLVGWYLPQLASELQKKNYKALGPFRLAVYDPRTATVVLQKEHAAHLKRTIICGYDIGQISDFSEVLPGIKFGNSTAFSKSGLALKHILSEQAGEKERGRGHALTSSQRRYIDYAPGKKRRVQGVAGSGKTVLICEKAALAASEGHRVLITHFNITLGSYLRHVISKTSMAFFWRNVATVHFHGLCSIAFHNAEIPWPTEDWLQALCTNIKIKRRKTPFETAELMDLTKEALNWYGISFTRELGKKVEEIDPSKINSVTLDLIVPLLMTHLVVDNIKLRKQFRFDQILIDEAQDFLAPWYDVLDAMSTNESEVLAVFDPFQDIYQRLPKGYGFKGRVGSLERSQRLPRQIQIEAQRFVQEFLPEIPVDQLFGEPDNQLSIDYFNLIWRNMHHGSDDVVKKTCLIFKWLIKTQKQLPKDIAILVPSNDLGLKVVDQFHRNKWPADHVFASGHEDDARVHKHTFFASGRQPKISTFHSFKGWEAKNVILIVDESWNHNNAELDILMFTSITRAKESLVVLNFLDRYREYGTGWEGGWRAKAPF